MENAKLYTSANGMQKKDAKEILTEFRDKIKWRQGGRVLDVGCGSGEVTTEIILPQLPKDFKELIGLDVSLDMIQHAVNLHSHYKVTFVQFDIAQNTDNILKDISKAVKASKTGSAAVNKIKSEDENVKSLIKSHKIVNYQSIKTGRRKKIEFDVIFSFYCLHWVPNQKLAFGNIYKLLKPGGEVLLTFLVQSPIFTLYRELSKIPLWKDYMQDVDKFIPFYQDSDYPVDNFIDIVKTVGFLVLTSYCKEKNYVFESFSSLRDAITAVNPFLSRIPQSLKKDFIDACLYQIEILNLATLKNNRYRVVYKLMVAHIQKPGC